MSGSVIRGCVMRLVPSIRGRLHRHLRGQGVAVAMHIDTPARGVHTCDRIRHFRVVDGGGPGLLGLGRTLKLRLSWGLFGWGGAKGSFGSFVFARCVIFRYIIIGSFRESPSWVVR